MRTIADIEKIAPGLATGPAMMALTELQRRFVLAMVSDPFGNRKEWAKAAGYSDKSNGAKVVGFRLMHETPKVEAAITEVARSLMFCEAPVLAVAGLLKIARNERHPKQLRALETLANRTGLHELSESRIMVEHRSESTEAMVARIRELAEKLGIDVSRLLGANAKDVSSAAKPGKVIEHSPADKGDGS